MTDTDAPVALLWHDAPTLAHACARRLHDDGLQVVLYHDAASASTNGQAGAADRPDGLDGLDGAAILRDVDGDGPEAVLDAVIDAHGGLDALVNLALPRPAHGSAAALQYAERLRERIDAAAERIAPRTESGAIVNQIPMPSLYTGTDLESSMPAVRGAVIGATRTTCLNWAREAVRVTCLQTGIVDAPEVDAFTADALDDVELPTGRRIDPAEVAHFVSFLIRKATYVTGQTVTVDGGLTSGIRC